MTLIKNIHLLKGVLNESDLDKMEHAALQHKRYAAVQFKIVDAGPGKVTFQIAQGKSAAENYFTKSRMIEIVHETFGRFFPHSKIIVHPVPYKMPAPNQVDPAWVQKKMLHLGIKLKQVSDDTGVDYTNLSAVLNEKAPMSQPIKALLYYYFSYKELIHEKG
jgi:hypothetical protein